jgi:hypothetical protein
MNCADHFTPYIHFISPQTQPNVMKICNQIAKTCSLWTMDTDFFMPCELSGICQNLVKWKIKFSKLQHISSQHGSVLRFHGFHTKSQSNTRNGPLFGSESRWIPEKILKTLGWQYVLWAQVKFIAGKTSICRRNQWGMGGDTLSTNLASRCTQVCILDIKNFFWNNNLE